MERSVIKRELIRLLRNNKEIEFIVDNYIKGVSGVEHKIDIHIVDPCDLALIITHSDLKIEVIKAAIISIDTHMPIILLTNENSFLRCKEELSKILETLPVKIITYKEQNLMKTYYKIVKECEKMLGN